MSAIASHRFMRKAAVVVSAALIAIAFLAALSPPASAAT